MKERFDTLALFVATVESGSLSGAARQTGLSISTISRQLTALEERLENRLLIRSTRKLVLTEAGSTYYNSAKHVLSELEQIELNLIESAQEPVGRVHISAPTLLGRHHLLPILADFLMIYPQINVEVTLLDRPVHLMDEGIDISLRVGELEDSSLLSRKLADIRWVLCAAPNYLQGRKQPQKPVDLLQHHCLVYSQHSSVHEWIFKAHNTTLKIKVPARMRSNTLDGVVYAAINGAGIVMTPLWYVEKNIKQQQLQILLPEYEMPPRPLYALFTHNKLMARKVRVLLDYLVEQMNLRLST